MSTIKIVNNFDAITSNLVAPIDTAVFNWVGMRVSLTHNDVCTFTEHNIPIISRKIACVSVSEENKVTTLIK